MVEKFPALPGWVTAADQLVGFGKEGNLFLPSIVASGAG